jgi:hypothetical protein
LKKCSHKLHLCMKLSNIMVI